jgi:DNA methyltransferase 1-associated protein 1
LNDYALRFYIVADRYEWPGSERHVEDLKARYYAICRKLFKARPLDSPTEQENRNTGTVQYGFDYGVFCHFSSRPSLIPVSPAKEKSRREFIENLWNRDSTTVAEEDILYLELKRLEQTERKFARSRDTLLRNLAGIESGLSGIDIQEDGLVGWGGNPADHPQPKRQGRGNRKSLRSAADLDYEHSSHPGSNMVISLGGNLPNRSLMPPAQQAAFGKSAQSTSERDKLLNSFEDAKHCITRAPPNLMHSSKNTHTPVHARSSKFPPMKQQTLVRIQQILQELEINSSRLVTPTKENIEHMDKLITVCQQLADARKTLEKLEDELRAQSIKMGLPVDPAPAASTGANVSAAGDGSPTTVTRGTSAGVTVARSQSVSESSTLPIGLPALTNNRVGQRKRTMSVSSSVDSSTTGPVHKRSRIG